MALFEIENLSFSYPEEGKRPALDGVSLSIREGEYLLICGRSGSGKTTLLQHLKPPLTPHGHRSGRILFDGRELDQLSLRDQAARIGYVMQDPDAQIVTDKVWHELAFGLESLGLDQRTIRSRTAEMASYFGIQDWFYRDTSDLSGGQKQLLNLASIMAMRPQVLILDEPTSQLDPIAAADFLAAIRKINLELGTTIIITEHRLEEIFPAADTVIVLEDGKISAGGSPRETAKSLYEKKSPMFEAMPSPVRIFSMADPAGGADWSAVPLTVREGRRWLTEHFSGKKIRVTSLPSPELEEIEDPAVLMKEVWFRYSKDGPDVLKGTTLTVPKGSFFCLAGGNGTGKSTALRALCGICRPYRGHVYIKGKRVDKYRGDLFDGLLALLPQDPKTLFAKKTVREELEEMGAPREEMEKIAGLCQIGDLLDEPTKGMDHFFKKKFASILDRLRKDGMTILMVSHDVEFCARYADYVGMFFDGNVITWNRPRPFFSQNTFYTTAANRMSRHVFENAVTCEDVAGLFLQNDSKGE